MNDYVIKVGDGILDQIEKSDFGIKIDPFWYCEEKKTTLIVSDVADYSFFVKKDLSDVKGVRIKTKSMNKWLTAKEIMATPSGSVLYFEDKVSGIFKNECIYPVVLYFKYSKDSFYKKMIELLCANQPVYRKSTR